MQRFNNGYGKRPGYWNRPGHNEIIIQPRSNGYSNRRSTTAPRKQKSAEEAMHQVSPTETLAEQIETLQAEASAWKEKYARLQAEQENERKRVERNFANQADQEKERVLRDMIPLADNLERALAHASEDIDNLQEGIGLTLKAFATALAKHGVEPIAAEGQPFDPNLHEALGTVPHPTLPPGRIARVEEKGYTVRGKLLRPARVLVTA